jgi:hypothetical protein
MRLQSSTCGAIQIANNLAIRRLGGKAWQRLHRFVYLAAILERISAELNRDSRQA